MFFEPIAHDEREPAPRRRRSPRDGPPRGVVPGILALELVLAKTDEVLVALPYLAVYPSGYGFELIISAGSQDPELDVMLGHGPRFRHARRADGLPAAEELLRFGLQFADGRKIGTEAGGPPRNAPGEELGIAQAGGSGDEAEWRQDYWAWPLPPAGPVTFALEWRAAGVALTLKEIDGQAVIDAAARSQAIFPEDEVPSTIGGRRVVRHDGGPETT